MEPDQIVSQTTAHMKKAVDHTLHEFGTIHTGKASPAMVETVQVDAYGSMMPLKEVAAITTPDSRTISIQPWDKTVLKGVESALLKANLGFTPTIMGDKIFCPLPELSKERRKELVKMCHNLAEQGKVGVRAARRDGMDGIKQAEKDKAISEDDRKLYEKEIQDHTDKSVKEIDQHLKHKEEELMKV
ncbi:MAG: ribosome recycling factor [Verrucomicrobiota bacterium]